MTMKRLLQPLSIFGATFAFLVAVSVPFMLKGAGVESSVTHHAAPRLFPDYTGIIIPPNIAPLNFKVEEPGMRYRVKLRSASGEPIVISSRSASIQIPPRAWRALLRANAGQPLYCEVSVQDQQSRWSSFETVTNLIARDEIDGYLTYRLLKPLYNVYVNLGIYQRDLQSFDERPVLQNTKMNEGCLNCHTFLNRRTDRFALNIRTLTNGNPMLLVCSNEVTRVEKTMGYLSWHPSGRLIAFSANKLSLFFHTVCVTRDVFDARSDLGIYRVDSNTFVFPSPIALTNRNETWPAWSPDGRYLYYCSAPVLGIEQFRQVRYDLMRTSYNIERDQWGEPEVLVSASETGLSAGEPKVSPDGRYVLFCLCQYGNFPIYQTNSDLYLLDLKTRLYHRLDINSDQADTWHCWSSNGRWVVFSSKRFDGLFARPFFSYVDEQGQFHKPFVLPQADPAFYNTYLKTFNVPELTLDPVTVNQNDLGRAVVNPIKVLAPKAEAEAQPASHEQQTSQGAGEGGSTYP
jgi:hypothetical protein